MLSDQHQHQVTEGALVIYLPCTWCYPVCLGGGVSANRVGLCHAEATKWSLTAKITPPALSKPPSRTAWT
jgi:hypothetical protein